jgi:hypothetical protein
MRVHSTRSRLAIAVGLTGAAALAVAGCNRDLGDARIQPAATSGMGMVVGCAPNQQTIVRPVVVNGATMSQVECVAAAAPGFAPAAYAPAAGVPGVVPVTYGYAQPVAQPYEDARIVQAPAAVRTVQPRRVAYQRAPERVVRNGRSWQKSAIIIGASSGIGAGVGAAVGGKKGALIGAALGGGASAIWDQVTRHKE